MRSVHSQRTHLDFRPIYYNTSFQKIKYYFRKFLSFFHLFSVHRIPFSADIVDQKSCEQKHVMNNHTGLGRNQSHTTHLGTQEGSHDSNAPHAGDAEYKGQHGIAHSLHHTLDDDGNTVKGF